MLRTTLDRPRPNVRRRTWIALSFCSLLASCAGPAEFLRRPKEPIVWPKGSAKPRIELVMSYHGSEDVERHPGFLASLLSVVTGSEKQALVTPSGLVLGADNVLWIADTGRAGVHKLSLTSGEHEFFRGPGNAPLQTPIGIAAVPDGRIYVTDSSTSRIMVLSAAGTYLRSFGRPDEIGRPTGIAYDPTRDRLLVLDTTGCRILVYDKDGEHLASIGKRGDKLGEFNYPTNIAVAKDGRVVVTDSMNFRVQILDSQLRAHAEFGIVGRGPGTFASPKGIALDGDGHIYVADALFCNVQIFDEKGRLLLPFGSQGSQLGQLYIPSGIHIDATNRIFVADSGNGRIQILRYYPRKP